MHTKGAHSSEHIRVSVSSTHSASSSYGSAPDDLDSLGEVYTWGETLTLIDPLNPNPKSDSLLPKPLESNLVLDARHLACGSKHAALLTRHGEIFTWGVEHSGRLGHGLVGNDVITPTLIDSLSSAPSDSVSCGEFHTCAITNQGDLYMWGLGHGNDDVTMSHWIPKRVAGPLDGLRIEKVSCGTYHTALITNTGQLFTFGDGSFGVLGHGNRESISRPKEVESVSGLKTISVSCGVWHTAAIVEVMASNNINSGISSGIGSGKLFTWGDGDKNRLGHGDRDPRLKPTCVASLIDYNFQKIGCGHSLTVGLTTTGQVLTMGSTVYGQLGNPRYDGRLPCLIEDNLTGETVTDISCGAYHVAVLTSKSEIYTWGKGANGRLGHGDLEDKKVPTLVETLKDRSVKQISCGSSFTACVCLRRWGPGSDQSQCANCRLTFGFTRKRHHCYNCGLVHCHSCSSKKALGADLAPNPAKPYRVCDSCYTKLSKSLPGLDIIRSLDLKAAARNRKHDNFSSLSLIRAPQVGSMLQLRDFDLGGSKAGYRVPQVGSMLQLRDFDKTAYRAVRSVNPSRAASPLSRMHSPPRSVTPVPVSLSKAGTESLRKTNEMLNAEIEKLRSQVESLKQKCELHEAELQRSAKKVQEAVTLASEESAKSKAAKEVIKSLTSQLKEMAERLPDESHSDSERKSLHIPNGISDSSQTLNGLYHQPVNPNPLSPNPEPSNQPSETEEESITDRRLHEELSTSSSSKELESPVQFQNGEVGSRVRIGAGINNLSMNDGQVEAEWIEQYEPGVYITLTALRDGTRDLKRVRFSRRRFGEHQAESWWWENREKVYEKYNVRGADRAPSTASLRSIN
ncbi:hypothetical protein LUZ60_013358 [Juncus effusus]|nr:hypothetical protein LUZ60_013358 [Juncus effusus]